MKAGRWQRWEYMTWIVGYAATDELTVDDWRGGAVKYRNGVMCPDWREGPKLPDALSEAGDQGWELINLQYPGYGEDESEDVQDPILVFKRAKT